MNKNSWSGIQLYCTFCGSKLVEEFNTSEDKYDQASYYHCLNSKCYYSFKSALILFHPLGTHKSRAGDSWAIGYIK